MENFQEKSRMDYPENAMPMSILVKETEIDQYPVGSPHLIEGKNMEVVENRKTPSGNYEVEFKVVVEE